MESLTRILVEDILVFAYCDEDQIAEDFSVAQLERIAHALSTSTQDTILEFVRVVQTMANEARNFGQTERADRLDSMPSHLGLA
jgi:hypothetical protein